MSAGHARRVFDADPSKRVAVCDAVGRPRWSDVWLYNPIVAPPEAVARGEPVHRIVNAPGARPYLHYPFTRETGWRFTDWCANDHRGQLYFSQEERARARRRSESLGPFVVIEPSLSADSNRNKAWIATRWFDLVHTVLDRHFVQFLHPDSEPLSGVTHIPTASFREACALLAFAEALVTTEGGLHHAAAALYVPAVVIFGGCASVTTTGYDGHINLAFGEACGRYLPCAHCREAMQRITVADVTDAVRVVAPTRRESRAAS